MERHEDAVRSQLDKMDSKLDEIQETLAKAAGEKSNISHLGKIALAVFAAVAGWFHFDITHLFRSGS